MSKSRSYKPMLFLDVANCLGSITVTNVTSMNQTLLFSRKEKKLCYCPDVEYRYTIVTARKP